MSECHSTSPPLHPSSLSSSSSSYLLASYLLTRYLDSFVQQSINNDNRSGSNNKSSSNNNNDNNDNNDNNNNNNTNSMYRQRSTSLNCKLKINNHTINNSTEPKTKQKKRKKKKKYSTITTTPTNYPRTKCCGSSRSLYCTECLTLLIPRNDWPASIRNGSWSLPFDLDVILDDRRNSATGLHAVVLCQASRANSDSIGGGGGGGNASPSGCGGRRDGGNETCRAGARLIDLTRGDTIPSYLQQTSETTDGGSGSCGTYLLFPSANSIPLSTVANDISKLIVLDCKWTRSSCRNLPELSHLPTVHLESPPSESHFWRWHNAGPGMLSTLEAIYFSAVQVSQCHPVVARYDGCQSDDDSDDDDDSDIDDDGSDVDDDDSSVASRYIDLMWLFGIQRAATCDTAYRHGRPVPFSKEGKELQRSFRRSSRDGDGFIVNGGAEVEAKVDALTEKLGHDCHVK